MANLKVKPEEARAEALKIVNYPKDTLYKAIKLAWDHMSEGLIQCWKGVDEYNFELVFANKVNNLYNNANMLVFNTAVFLEDIAQKSTEAANARKIELQGGNSGDISYASIEFAPWGFKGHDPETNTIVVAVSADNPNKNTPNQEIDYETYLDVSMKIGNFVSKINDAVSDFKVIAKGKLKDCLGGDWDESLDQYFGAVENCIKDILTAYEDIKNSSKELLTTVVENLTQGISKSVDDDKQEVTSMVDTNLSGSKWSS